VVRIPIVIAVSILTLPARAAQVDGDWRFSLAAGHDSNPLKVVGEGDGAAYYSLHAGAGFDWKLGDSWTWFGDIDGMARIHDTGAGDADTVDGGVRAGLAWRPGRRLQIRAGAGWEAYRSTFTDRATGDVYVVETDPPTIPASTVEIPDRFSHDTTRVFTQLSYKAGRRVRLSLDVDRNENRYVEDYSAATNLDPLDSTAVGVEPGVSVRISENVALRLSSGWVSVDYDALPALDAAGEPVPGTTRAYRYLAHRLVIAFDPFPGWDFNLGLGLTDRSDQAAGYYDYGAGAGYASVWRSLGERSRLGLYASVRNLTYDNATVFGDPASELRASDVRRYSCRFERRFGDTTRWFAEGGGQETDNTDPLFVYKRRWLAAGIDLRR
jgi:hypothetical protein